VQSENTVYSEGTSIPPFSTVVPVNGQYNVTPTVRVYQFQTARQVGKTVYDVASWSFDVALLTVAFTLDF
jgi:uncharacterized membrane protein